MNYGKDNSAGNAKIQAQYSIFLFQLPKHFFAISNETDFSTFSSIENKKVLKLYSYFDLSKLAALLITTIAFVFPVKAIAQEQQLPFNIGLIHFFNSDFILTDRASDDQGYQLSQYAVHLRAEFIKELPAFIEFSLTNKDEGRDLSWDFERFGFQYRYNEALRVTIGRDHTPISWYNTAFHHGRWLQTSIKRPLLARFGGEFIPIHWEGVFLDGQIPSSYNFAYQLGFGNGRDKIASDTRNFTDDNVGQAQLINVSIRPDSLYALQFGLTYYHDKVKTQKDKDVQEHIGGAYLIWHSETPEIIAEYLYSFHEKSNGGHSYSNSASYIQIGYRLEQLQSKVKVYSRWDNVSISSGDPIYLNTSSINSMMVGLRYDIHSNIALKIEGQHNWPKQGEENDSVQFQLALVF